jgi:hypothetical protein
MMSELFEYLQTKAGAHDAPVKNLSSSSPSRRVSCTPTTSAPLASMADAVASVPRRSLAPPPQILKLITRRLVRDPITGPARPEPGLHGICIAEVSGLRDALEPKIVQTCKWGKAGDGIPVSVDAR